MQTPTPPAGFALPIKTVNLRGLHYEVSNFRIVTAETAMCLFCFDDVPRGMPMVGFINGVSGGKPASRKVLESLSPHEFPQRDFWLARVLPDCRHGPEFWHAYLERSNQEIRRGSLAGLPAPLARRPSGPDSRRGSLLRYSIDHGASRFGPSLTPVGEAATPLTPNSILGRQQAEAFWRLQNAPNTLGPTDEELVEELLGLPFGSLFTPQQPNNLLPESWYNAMAQTPRDAPSPAMVQAYVDWEKDPRNKPLEFDWHTDVMGAKKR